MFLLLNEPSTRMVLAEARFPGLEKVMLNADVLPLAGCALVALVMLVCIIRWMGRSKLLRRAAAADEKFTSSFRYSAHALALFQNGETVPGSPRSALYTNACRELAFHLLGSDAVDKGFSLKLRAAGRITPSQLQATQHASRRSMDESARWFRAGLSSSGVKSLLSLGLLGSLVALMEHAGAGTLDLTAAASSARPFVLGLLCYVIGIAWHCHVVRRADEAMASLEDFALELGMLFERSFVDHRHPMEALPSLGGMGMTDGPSFSLPPSEPSRAVGR